MPKAYLVLKRAMDFAIALTGFIVLSWLFLIITIFVKRDSEGNVFYRQERLTKNEKPFTIIKFRSMVKDARKIQFKKHISPKKLVTPAGKFLRRTHFDEWLQLLNVLKGEMSLVGPRPLMRKWHYAAVRQNKNAAKRAKVRVGMTSLERLMNLAPERREKIFSMLPNAERLKREIDPIEFDLYYVENISFKVDAIIFIETLRLVLRKLFS